MATLERETLDVSQVAAILGIHKITAYDSIRNGTFPLPVITVGRRYVIPRAAVERLLSGEAEK